MGVGWGGVPSDADGALEVAGQVLLELVGVELAGSHQLDDLLIALVREIDLVVVIALKIEPASLEYQASS